jgi:hypothetical protein
VVRNPGYLPQLVECVSPEREGYSLKAGHLGYGVLCKENQRLA